MKKIFSLFFFLLVCQSQVACQNQNQNQNQIDSLFIMHTKTNRMIKSKELFQKLSDTDYIFLGEFHNNHYHHQVRSQIVKKLKSLDHGTTQTTVGFEQIISEKQKEIDAFLLKNKISTDEKTHSLKDFEKEVDEFQKILKWQEGGWGKWSLYRPLFLETLRASYSVRALNLPKNRLREIYKNGINALDKDFVLRTGLGEKFNEKIQKKLFKDIDEGHCSTLNEENIERISFIQRARDAFMMDKIFSEKGGKKIIIAGNGHVRKDYGMPWYFKKLNEFYKNKKSVAINKKNQRALGSFRSISIGFFSKDQNYDFKNYDYIIFLKHVRLKNNPCDIFKKPR